jgi:hypothetical protein
MNLNYYKSPYDASLLIRQIKSVHPNLDESNPLTYAYLLQNPNLSEEDRKKYEQIAESHKNNYLGNYEYLKLQLLQNGAKIVDLSNHELSMDSK